LAGIELQAYWELERLGGIRHDEYYSPCKAAERYYSKKLQFFKDLLKQRARKSLPPSTPSQ
tara:strand:- start:309 stop:491 length:183 start_codon:yes stop_codon:yes gene_type:complete